MRFARILRAAERRRDLHPPNEKTPSETTEALIKRIAKQTSKIQDDVAHNQWLLLLLFGWGAGTAVGRW